MWLGGKPSSPHGACFGAGLRRGVQLEAEEHKRRAHPYAPFPVQRLEAAVTSVRLEAFAAFERDLARFGPAYHFW